MDKPSVGMIPPDKKPKDQPVRRENPALHAVVPVS
jgi:hypothetical protein